MKDNKVQHLRIEPTLRFNKFNSDWESIKLVDFGNFKNGLNKDKSAFGHGFPLVNLDDLFNKSNLSNVPVGLVDCTAKDRQVYSVKEGDTLFVRSSVKLTGVGTATTILTDLHDTVYSGFIIRYRQFENRIDKIFGQYLLNSPMFRKEILKRATTSANTNINQESLSEISVNIPILKEQKEIGQFLSEVDRKIILLEKKIENLKLFNKGLFSSLYRKNNLTKLGEVNKLQGGYAFKSEEYKTEGIPIIRITNITENVNYTNSDYKFYKMINIEDKFKVRENDILIAMSGATTGKVGRFTEKDEAYLNQRVGKFVPNNKLLDLSYLFHFLKSYEFMKELSRFLVAGAQPNISSHDIGNIRINIPDINEQIKVSRLLDNNDSKIQLLELKLETLKEFKKGLLQQMFI